MKKYFLLFITACIVFNVNAQNKLTPEKLWQLGRLSAIGMSKDKQYVLYSVSIPNVSENKSSRKTYKIPVTGGEAIEITDVESLMENSKISADGKYMISSNEVQVLNVKGSDIYKDLPKSNAYVFTSLNYRHWDTWEDGKFDHVFLTPLMNGKPSGEAKDLMKGEAHDCPTKPFGGDEDFIWNPDGKRIVYVTKKTFGTAYAVSTNSDLYEYNVETGLTKNLTEKNKGYDVSPQYNKKGIFPLTILLTSDGSILKIWEGKPKENTKEFISTLNSFISKN